MSANPSETPFIYNYSSIVFKNPFSYDLNKIVVSLEDLVGPCKPFGRSCIIDLIIFYIYCEIPASRRTMNLAISILNSIEYDVMHNTDTMDFALTQSESDFVFVSYNDYKTMTAAEKLSEIKQIRKTFAKLGYDSEYEEGDRFVI